MRFISIEDSTSSESVLVNVTQISSIVSIPVGATMGHKRVICVNLAGGSSVSTKFTSIEHAVDYIQRAPSVSMGGHNGTMD
jgi:hypothetical protein